MFGMSSKEFWEEDPQLYWAYQTFYLNKQKNEFERENQNMWLQGMYIYEGFSIALSNMFSKTQKTYSTEPYNLNKNTKELTNKEIDQVVMDKNNAWSRLV